MKHNLTRLLFTAFGISLLLLVSPIAFYCYQFAKNGLSDDSQDWSALGDFLNVWVSMASLILLATLTYVIYRNEQHRDDQRDLEMRTRNRPLLIFRVESREKAWYIKNVGNGVALNIFISSSQKKDVWGTPVRMYSLMTGEEFRIYWFRAALQICASYNDFLSEDTLVTVIENDQNKFLNENPLRNFEEKRVFKRLEDVPDIDQEIKDWAKKPES